MSDFQHIPVLFYETVDALDIKPDGIYVDCTAGGGGHSAAVAEKLTTGRLISIDQDPEAIATLQKRFADNPKVTIVHDNFVNIKSVLSSLGIVGVDGVMADLGVSSHQLDTDARGFSFHKDAPLDMRMSMSGISAADIVNNASEAELRRIIYTYGEEKFAPSIAKNIVKARNVKPIETTFELVDIKKASMPIKAKRDGHPARKTFQALRIEVNQELEKLEKALDDMFDVLNPEGRLAIITFHSLEDRMVKKRFNSFCEGCTCPPQFPVCVCGKKPEIKIITKKPITATEEEMEYNSRSKCAKLRIAERI